MDDLQPHGVAKKGWNPLEHEGIDTERSKDYGGQHFVAAWMQSLSVL